MLVVKPDDLVMRLGLPLSFPKLVTTQEQTIVIMQGFVVDMRRLKGKSQGELYLGRETDKIDHSQLPTSRK